MPIFLAALLPAWASILTSVTLILAFGEVKYIFNWHLQILFHNFVYGLDLLYLCFLCFQIIPQAVCSRYGLAIGAKLSFVVRLIVIALFPLSYPISKVALLPTNNLILLVKSNRNKSTRKMLDMYKHLLLFDKDVTILQMVLENVKPHKEVMCVLLYGNRKNLSKDIESCKGGECNTPK